MRHRESKVMVDAPRRVMKKEQEIVANLQAYSNWWSKQ